jgi:TrmH family RNA methyltransferase
LLASLESERLVVVLVHPRNPLNIGAAARAMSNFGVTRLRLVAPYEVAFRNARSAVGASAVLEAAEQFDTVAEALTDCQLVIGTTAVKTRDLQHPLRELNVETGRAIRSELSSRTVALMFGSEKFGLSNEDLTHCHWLLRIPAREEHPSMNLGQAVAVCLYEVTRNENVPVVPDSIPQLLAGLHATAGDEERIVVSLMEALNLSEYVRRHTEESVQENARRFVRRLNLQRSDAELWLGMLRQMIWKLKGGKHEE